MEAASPLIVEHKRQEFIRIFPSLAQCSDLYREPSQWKFSFGVRRVRVCVYMCAYVFLDAGIVCDFAGTALTCIKHILDKSKTLI